MHIAYLTETYPPELNGVANTVARFVGDLRARGHAVQLIRPRQPADTACDTDEEWRTPGSRLPMYPDLRIGWPVVSRLVRRWSRLRPDLVHVATEGPLGWAGTRAARLLGIPVTSDFRTNFDQYSAHYGFGWMRAVVGAYLRHFHNATDRTFVPTPAMRNALAASGYQRLDVIGRGVDCSRYSPHYRSAELRQGWGADAATPVLLYVGRLAAEKNVSLAFRTYKAVRARVPNARMVVVGDGPLRSRLERRYVDVVFTGPQRGPDLSAHYASADIFLFPSLTETFGNVTLEALASGLLVVAFRAGAAALHIEDCSSGMLVDAGDDQGFVAAACALSQQFAWLTPMRERARDAGLAASWETVITRFERALTSMIHAVEAPYAGSCPA